MSVLCCVHWIADWRGIKKGILSENSFEYDEMTGIMVNPLQKYRLEKFKKRLFFCVNQNWFLAFFDEEIYWELEMKLSSNYNLFSSWFDFKPLPKTYRSHPINNTHNSDIHWNAHQPNHNSFRNNLKYLLCDVYWISHKKSNQYPYKSPTS